MYVYIYICVIFVVSNPSMFEGINDQKEGFKNLLEP